MPFLVITGEFVPEAGHPDGDSVRFRPDTPELLYRLRRRGHPHKLSPSSQTVQLRFEGIDTLEKNANPQFADAATASNLELCGVAGGSGTARGYICSTQLGPHGRPIAFVFAGDEPPVANGDEVFLRAADLGSSINGQQLALGHAYPLFYDTLYYDLRRALAEFADEARTAGRGVWAEDASQSGVTYGGPTSLRELAPIFPKLWRRLDHYSTDRDVIDPQTLAEFRAYLEYDRSDRVLVLDKGWHTGFHNLVDVDGDTIKLREAPENLVFTS